MHFTRTPRLLASLTQKCPTRLAHAAPFSASTYLAVKVGDAIPDLEVLTENSPGNKVNLAKELKGNGLIIGVPAAFSPSCSNSHVPGFLQHPKLASSGSVFVVSVNDPFVMKAWQASLDPEAKSGVRFLADPSAAFTSALDLTFDSKAIFGADRSKRYVLAVEDGKVKEAFVEPDNTGVNESSAEMVLGKQEEQTHESPGELYKL